MKKKIFIFTFTPHPGYHMILPGCFVWRGLHDVELSAGRKVHGNIFIDADVHHQMTSFTPSFVALQSLHRRFLCRQCRLKALAAVYILVLVSLRRKIFVKPTSVILQFLLEKRHGH